MKRLEKIADEMADVIVNTIKPGDQKELARYIAEALADIGFDRLRSIVQRTRDDLAVTQARLDCFINERR